MLKKTVIFLVLVAVVGLGAAYLIRNLLVERAVEEGGSYALGVSTSLGSAGLDIGGSSVELKDLEIANPDGYESEPFLTIGRGLMRVDAGSIFDDLVVVDSFVIENVRLNLEQIDTRGNWRDLMNHVNRLDFGESSGDEQKFNIGLIAIRGVEVAGSLTALGEKRWEKTFSVPTITLKDVGGDSGVSVGELTAKVVKTIISKAMSSGEGVFPGGFGGDLSGVIDQGVEKVNEEAVEQIRNLGKNLLGGKK